VSNPKLDKSRTSIQSMFSEIAGRYDLANSVLSLGLHHLWKRALVKEALRKAPGGLILDLCTGTGDILKQFNKAGAKAFGADFALPMLQLQAKRTISNCKITQADALRLPFKDQTFELITVSYGIRNFESLNYGLIEIMRVLKPGGYLFILEFGQKPKGAIGAAIKFYERCILPTLGGLISGKSKAYNYLAKSSKDFPSGEQLIKICQEVGFKEGKVKTLCFGASYLYELQA
jgi:demethylmenaquinone methyltransferase/2-methoxy-6-polyprenyl-1,4-benzoquinol methylase